MAFLGDTPVNSASYIQAGFDGEIEALNLFSPMAIMEKEDPTMNVYNFHFDEEYGTDGREWFMNFHITFTGSFWQRPTVQWVTVVNPIDTTIFGMYLIILGRLEGKLFCLLILNTIN